MRRLGLVLVCGLAACGKSKSGATQGSAATAGSAVVVAPAAPPDAAAVAVASADAAPAPAVAPTLSANGGLSTLGRFDWSAQDEDATAELVQSKLGLPGVKVSFDVMDVPGDVEREEGYWSVKRGETEIMQLFRTTSGTDTKGPLAVTVWTADIPTADGTKVGDTVATVLAKHPDLACKEEMIAETLDVIQCKSAAEKALGYVVNPKKAKVKSGKTVAAAKIATVDIIGLSHEF